MKSHVQIFFGHLCWVGDLHFPHFGSDFFPVSIAAQVTPCRKDGGTFSLSGCEPDACRSFPVDDFKSGYVVCRGGWEGMGVKMGCIMLCTTPMMMNHSHTWIIAPGSVKRGGEVKNWLQLGKLSFSRLLWRGLLLDKQARFLWLWGQESSLEDSPKLREVCKQEALKVHQFRVPY